MRIKAGGAKRSASAAITSTGAVMAAILANVFGVRSCG